MPSVIVASLLVGAGGFVGSVARYGLSAAAQRLALEWPGGTLAANLLGCFLVGIIAEMVARGQAVSPEARLLLATGFCGGFTTLSSWVYESAQLMRAQAWLQAALYVGATLVGALAAFILGALLVRVVLKTAGA